MGVPADGGKKYLLPDAVTASDPLVALKDTDFGDELLKQLAEELRQGRAPVEWQLSKVVMIPKPGKDHAQLKEWRPINLSSAKMATRRSPL